MIVSPIRWINHAAALWKLIRIIPVLCWGGGAVFLGISASVSYLALSFPWLNFFFALFTVLLLQGIASHSLNDYEDWKSGTDQLSPGILSGGSGVIRLNLFTPRQLLFFTRLSFYMSVALTCYLCYHLGSLHLFLFLLVGLWAVFAYTSPPFRLSYRPLIGEWLAAWPAMVACTAGTSFLLIERIPVLNWWAGILHATISIAWLMQHHLPDIAADLMAKPAKNTTVAYVCARWGWRYVTMPSALYYFIAVLLGLNALALHSGFAISILAGLLGMILALTTDPRNLSDITRKQIGMMMISCLHFFLLSLSFIYY